VVSKEATKTGSLRISKTAPVDIENVTIMITTIPFNYTIHVRNMRRMREGGVVNSNGIVNIESKASERPLFIVEAHKVAMTPHPPKTSRECKRKRTCKTIFQPSMRVIFGEELISAETNMPPNFRGVQAVADTMKKGLIMLTATSTQGRMGDIPMT
jgi:hypothetical protein